MTERYWVEYDENGCTWLVHVGDKHRIAMEHGMVLDVDTIERPQYPPPALERTTP